MVALTGIMLAAQLPQVGSVVKIIGPVGDGLLPGPGEEGAQQGQILRRDGEEPQGLPPAGAILTQETKRLGHIPVHGDGIDGLAAVGHFGAEKERVPRRGIFRPEIIPPEKGPADGAVADPAGLKHKIGAQQRDLCQCEGLKPKLHEKTHSFF